MEPDATRTASAAEPARRRQAAASTPPVPPQPPPPPHDGPTHHLLGSPAEPWVVRWSKTTASASRLSNWLSIVTCIGIFLRQPADHCGLAICLWVYSLGSAADQAWRRARPAAWARWREWGLPLLALPCIVALARLHVVNVVAAQFEPGRSGVVGTVRHAALLLIASRVATNWLVFCKLTRISWSLPAHTLMTAAFMSDNAASCSIPALQSAAAARVTAALAWGLDSLQLRLAPVLLLRPPLEPPLSPAEECRLVLNTLQLVFGLALPVLGQGAFEALCFMLHQRQRLRHGLPPETGWQARLYGGIVAALFDLDSLSAAVLAWSLYSVLFLVATMLATEPRLPRP